MSTAIQRSNPAGENAAPLAPMGAAPIAPVNPLQMIYAMLRGRIIWAVLLLLIGGAAGGYAGYHFGHKIYRSHGAVRVVPVLPRVLYGIDDKNNMGNYDSFVEAQIALFRSQRVIDMAMQSDEWKGTKRGTSDEETLKFIESLAISRSGEFINVDFLDVDSTVAGHAVVAMINSYQKLYKEADAESDEHRMDILQQRQTNLSNSLASYRQRILALANQDGFDDLTDLLHSKLTLLNLTDASLKEVQERLAGLENAPPPTTGRAAVAPAPVVLKEMTPEQLAAADERMRELLKKKRALEEALQDLKTRGVKEKQHDYALATKQLDVVNGQIKSYLADYEHSHPPVLPVAAVPTTGPSEADARGLDVIGLGKRERALQKMYDEQKDYLQELGRRDLQIKDLRAESDTVKQYLEETNRRIEQLNVESNITGRIVVFSSGDRPLQPFLDDHVKLAGTGAAAGGLGGVGLVLLFGFLDRRVRHVDDMKGGFQGQPMLGILPELPDDMADPEKAALAAHCVHQIRGLLQIWSGPKNHTVFAITSPVAGTGKTSLALALGVSFAAAGSRTLLIDCDLVGGGLTARVNAIIRRKIGNILQREGLVNGEQLGEALRLAHGSRRRLGEILIELGYLKEAEVAGALARQEAEPIGILDAMIGDDLDDCIAETGTPGLSVLPLGAATAEHVGRLSPQVLRQVVQAARERFDIVIIDSGPIPGSLEAAVVAAEADGVILTVSRGEGRPLITKCIAHLQSVGAHVAGFVFNRAAAQDMAVVYSSTFRTSSTASAAAGAPASDNFTPLGTASASAVPSGGSKNRRARG